MTQTQLDNTKKALVKKAEDGNGKKPVTIADWLQSDSFKAQMALVLPKHITADRLARVALFAIRTNANLLKCNRDSLLAAVLQSAQLGLEPGILGHCYFIPYGNNVQFIIGYKGYLELLRRSGEISSIDAQIVYENDFLRLTYGMKKDLEHVPWHVREDNKFKTGGTIKGAYVVVTLKDGFNFMHYMPWYEIEQRKNRSAGVKSGRQTPWATDLEAMVKKTVVRDAMKWLPLSIEDMRKVLTDETIGTTEKITSDMTEFTIEANEPIAEDQEAIIEADYEVQAEEKDQLPLEK